VTTARRIVLACLLAALAATIALTAPLGGDYPGPTCPTCDYAGPPIDALVHGHLPLFFHTQPVMGSFSLLLRAPFVALSHVGHHGLRWEYRLGSLACLLGVALLAWLLISAMARRGRSLLSQGLIAALLLASPLTFMALSWGHPEELLAGALCVIAILLVTRRQPVLGGVALGLALATKPWAWLAVLPVLLVATGSRRRVLISALIGGGLLTLPMFLGDPARFLHLTRAFGVAGSGVTPTNIWWPYAHLAGIQITPHGSMDAYAVPGWMGAIAHPLVAIIGVALPLWIWKGRRTLDAADALNLMAAVLLVRCVLDPLTYSYHNVPTLLAVISAEAVSRRRVPYVSLVSTAALWAITKLVAPAGNPDLLNRTYLLWALATLVYLLGSLLAPNALAQLPARLGLGRARRAPISATQH
jgi:hypothetical protein